jgi:amidase
MAGSTLNTAMTMASCAAVGIPAGFDQYGRPVGLQIAAPPRQEARALAAALYLERLTGLDKMLPIDPKSGIVPPS